MRAAPGEYLRLGLRAHDLLRDVPLYDVSVVDLPGGGARRSVADIRALATAATPKLSPVLPSVRSSCCTSSPARRWLRPAMPLSMGSCARRWRPPPADTGCTGGYT